jgi:hypothetical protein
MVQRVYVGSAGRVKKPLDWNAAHAIGEWAGGPSFPLFSALSKPQTWVPPSFASSWRRVGEHEPRPASVRPSISIDESSRRESTLWEDNFGSRASDRPLGSYHFINIYLPSIRRLRDLTGGIPGRSSDFLGRRSTSWARWPF